MGCRLWGHKELETTKQLSTHRGQMKHWMEKFFAGFMQRRGGYWYLFSYAHWLIGWVSVRGVSLGSLMNLTFLWLFIQFSTCQVLALPCPSDFNASLKVAHHTFLVSVKVLSHTVWSICGSAAECQMMGVAPKRSPKEAGRCGSVSLQWWI